MLVSITAPTFVLANLRVPVATVKRSVNPDVQFQRVACATGDHERPREKNPSFLWGIVSNVQKPACMGSATRRAGFLNGDHRTMYPLSRKKRLRNNQLTDSFTFTERSTHDEETSAVHRHCNDRCRSGAGAIDHRTGLCMFRLLRDHLRGSTAEYAV